MVLLFILFLFSDRDGWQSVNHLRAIFNVGLLVSAWLTATAEDLISSDHLLGVGRRILLYRFRCREAAIDLHVHELEGHNIKIRSSCYRLFTPFVNCHDNKEPVEWLMQHAYVHEATTVGWRVSFSSLQSCWSIVDRVIYRRCFHTGMSTSGCLLFRNFFAVAEELSNVRNSLTGNLEKRTRDQQYQSVDFCI